MERNVNKAQPEKTIKAPVINLPFDELLCPFCKTPVDDLPDVCPTCGAPLDYTRFFPADFICFDVTPGNLPLLIDKYCG